MAEEPIYFRERVEKLGGILIPHIYHGLRKLYSTAKELRPDHPLKMFQLCMKRIPNLGKARLTEDFRVLLQTISRRGIPQPQVWLEKILGEIFLSYVRTNVELPEQNTHRRQERIINLDDIDVPPPSDFVHRVYIEACRRFWMNPGLFSDNWDRHTLQRNILQAKDTIKDSIQATIRDYVPLAELSERFRRETQYNRRKKKAETTGPGPGPGPGPKTGPETDPESGPTTPDVSRIRQRQQQKDRSRIRRMLETEDRIEEMTLPHVQHIIDRRENENENEQSFSLPNRPEEGSRISSDRSDGSRDGSGGSDEASGRSGGSDGSDEASGRSGGEGSKTSHRSNKQSEVQDDTASQSVTIFRKKVAEGGDRLDANNLNELSQLLAEVRSDGTLPPRTNKYQDIVQQTQTQTQAQTQAVSDRGEPSLKGETGTNSPIAIPLSVPESGPSEQVPAHEAGAKVPAREAEAPEAEAEVPAQEAQAEAEVPKVLDPITRESALCADAIGPIMLQNRYFRKPRVPTEVPQVLEKTNGGASDAGDSASTDNMLEIVISGQEGDQEDEEPKSNKDVIILAPEPKEEGAQSAQPAQVPEPLPVLPAKPREKIRRPTDRDILINRTVTIELAGKTGSKTGPESSSKPSHESSSKPSHESCPGTSDPVTNVTNVIKVTDVTESEDSDQVEEEEEGPESIVDSVELAQALSQLHALSSGA